MAHITRMIRSRWRDPRLLSGFTLIILSGILGGFLLSGPETVAVYQAQQTIVPGTPIAQAKLTLVDISPELAQAYVTPSDANADAVVEKLVRQGELVGQGSLKASDSTGVRIVLPLLSAPPSSVDVGATVRLWHVAKNSFTTGAISQAEEITRQAHVIALINDEKISAKETKIEVSVPEDVAQDVVAVLGSEDAFVVTTGGAK